MKTSYKEYEEFIYSLSRSSPSIIYSTLIFQRLEPLAAIVRGEVFFNKNIRLRVLEILDFADELEFIKRYSYEVYQNDDKLYWYDSFPHPHNPELASTHPHHKHIPPDIKNHRVPAPGISFENPNIPFIINEIETTVLKQ